MERITRKHLDALANRINKITKNPETSWTKDDKGMNANIGNYHIDNAYGGYGLCQMVNDGGGVRSIIGGFRPARELYDMMQAYINGLYDGREP